jgi:hypothetical protein
MPLQFKPQLGGVLAQPVGQTASLMKRNVSKGINQTMKPAHNLVRDPISNGASGLKKSFEFDKATIPKQEATIQSSHPLTKLVEDDTKPHQIRPINAKVLAFKVKSKIIFTKLVNHPGTKGKHSWVKGAKHVDAHLMNNLKRAMDAALEGIAI